MKNTILLCGLCFFTVLTSLAQVGIGTTIPQEALHVAGNSSTIRIEGLNSTNNIENLGGGDIYNLMVDADGDLTIGNQSGEIMSDFDNLAIPVVIQTTPTAGLNSAELYQKTFTLTQNALVVINYTISMDFYNYGGTAAIDDGRSKMGHNYFYLGDGTTADTSKAYGMTTSVYANSDCDTASGYVYNSQSVSIPLGPGTHSVHLYGSVYGGNASATAAFRVLFGNRDSLEIHALYY